MSIFEEYGAFKGLLTVFTQTITNKPKSAKQKICSRRHSMFFLFCFFVCLFFCFFFVLFFCCFFLFFFLFFFFFFKCFDISCESSIHIKCQHLISMKNRKKK